MVYYEKCIGGTINYKPICIAIGKLYNFERMKILHFMNNENLNYL